MTTERRYELPAALFEIGKLIGAELEPATLLARIAELVCQLTGAEACSVMLLDAERKRLFAKAGHGLRTELVQTLSFAIGQGVAGWTIEHGQAALIHDVAHDPRFVVLPASATPISSMVCVPLIANGDRVGVVTATCPTRGAFACHDLETVKLLADTIAVDIEHVRVHRVAVTDPLTGSFNRDFLLERLPQEIIAAADRDRALSVAMVNVDHFKTVNERYGRAIGDIVLSEVARRLRAAIRAGDLLVRYEGETFLALLPKACAGRAWEVGERMRQRVSERAFDLGDGFALLLRVSIGVAQWHAAEQMPSLLERANLALYDAKGRGRNRVEVSP